jgi:hypothetical protein
MMLVDEPEFDLRELAADWAWLINLEEYKLEAVSPFGDLLLRDRSDPLCLLDINLGAIEYTTEITDDPAIAFPVAFDDRIAAGYREAQLFLKPATCYGYKIQCIAGGSVEIENVYVATLAEYVSFMGCFHFQIRDVEDGESVVIKVVRPSVN